MTAAITQTVAGRPNLMASHTLLRAVVHRLSSTPVKELPPFVPYLASALSDSRVVLSTVYSQTNASESELFILIQKLKVRITGLLQDKSVEGRWVAVVIVKAVIEAGQWEILHGCANWVRSLLTILGVSVSLAALQLRI